MSLIHGVDNTSCRSHIIREAVPNDLDFVMQLERECFAEKRQSSKRSLQNSISSTSQLVLIIESSTGRKKNVKMGAAVIIHYKRSIRIYSLAIDRNYRKTGVGEALVRHIINFASSHGYERISLEADINNPRLVDWYNKFGFEAARALPDYYGPGESGLRMSLVLSTQKTVQDRLLIVTDDVRSLKKWSSELTLCSAQDYLSDHNYAKSNRFHILNICNSYKIHSLGYYVSLLANARNHMVIPSVVNMKDVTTPMVAQSLLDEIENYLAAKLSLITKQNFSLTIIMGKSSDQRFSELAQKLFRLFSIPFFSLCLQRKDRWVVKKIKVLSVKNVMAEHEHLLQEALGEYSAKKRYTRPRLKHFKYDLAILVNPEEKTPPSCPDALDRFRKAAEKTGFYVEFITKADKRRICEFDALFIRETTAIENHTYAISRHAYTEGLVVIDDPWSIMLCSNKVFLHEKLGSEGICQPRGWLLTKKDISEKRTQSLVFPLVLKLPESSFSQGVYRVDSHAELQERLNEMLKKSDLVIAQEFLVSEYDWRIGVLDNKPIFACKYFMAKNHWQIYNWDSSDAVDFSGQHEAVRIDQVPPSILKAAVRSSSLIGNGFYGVDLKEIGGKAYVIEVNDNPNVDFGIEDQLLGNELYERIMQSIFDRIELERQQIRYIS
ncbi:GNAT family N-acetyltransferase [Maridesulfovibrio salexigens]|uniref:GCN5-related N-acetyltransferase n=1 Tax=Maridesulfovibrio salexigens (strain ATCC 14822 / DSM 2638 / NCIMB 8403 / VKM B-1763) TaxID=526222 RepID=C6C085_MARSD|nr:GNAT family N-acetyltransferase [Maridesulfovibrio salexigens]ACS80956.1 GCN5-related N-acetyltransferase [Maridesulfovibrio salexigens DSM 2638]